jgi:hypothetical protein
MIEIIPEDKIKNEIDLFQKGIDKLKAEVSALKITDETTNTNAVEFLKLIKIQYKKVEDQRKYIVKPLNDLVKKHNADFKPLTTALSNAEREIKSKMTGYAREVEAENRRIEEMNRKKEEKFVEKVAEGKAVKAPVLKQAKEVKAEGQSFRSVRKWEIEDATKIPREYLIIDTKKINTVVRAGIDVPGLKIWEDKVVAIRS